MGLLGGLFVLLITDLFGVGNLQRLIETVLPPPSGRKPNLLVGTNPWPGYAPFYLARRLGLYQGKGVDFVEYPSTSMTLKALRNGAIQAAALTLDETLQLYELGTQFKVVLVLDYSAGADAILARPPLASLADLKNKKIAFENSTLGGYFLTRTLERSRMHPDDFELVPLEVDEHLQAYLQEKVDGVVTMEPYKTALERAGAKKIFSSKDLPQEIIDVLVVREDWLAGDVRALKFLAEGWFEALRQLQEAPEQMAPLLGEQLNLNPKEALEAVAGVQLLDQKANLALFVGSPSPFDQSARVTNDFLLSHQLLSRKVSLEGLADPILLR
ncbi:MAG: hypothetical protein A2600_00825 [Candidatus Lambdaproteobacteria bacterium RIFOXYD1_FULL_56_27]|nr:MAG: hypothetical protein A2426_04035 [Candidatus Lambdaproteobacteria bacterium RIFOXYC1_FULL_56_13]OGH07097.1 MAG: hypothetical protein A2600_00825 [Candidatus Lambdaproteobacteria bacterium RIFOXYD1_FULL_56_27]